jgi:hypothetical protein
MNTLCNDPYLYTIDNFLTDKECNFIINASKDNLKLAGVSTMNLDKISREINIKEEQTQATG